MKTIRCRDCGTDPVQSSHKNDATQECPDCGDILYREINP